MVGKSYVGLDHCPRCGESTGVLLDRRLVERFEDSKKYSSGNLCDDCKKDIAQMKEVVDAGGIYLKCNQCKMEAAMRLTDNTKEFVTAVRNRLNVPKGPCGAEFGTCEEHESFGIENPMKQSSDEFMDEIAEELQGGNDDG